MSDGRDHRSIEDGMQALQQALLLALKTNPLKPGDLDDFVRCYNAENRHQRSESERFKSFAHEDLLKRDKVSLDIFWPKDDSLEDSANLPDPDVIAAEIAEAWRRHWISSRRSRRI